MSERYISPEDKNNTSGITGFLRVAFSEVINYFDQNGYASRFALSMQKDYSLLQQLRTQQDVEEYVRKKTSSSGFNVDQVVHLVLNHFTHLPKK